VDETHSNIKKQIILIKQIMNEEELREVGTMRKIGIPDFSTKSRSLLRLHQ
jgi:hypothetical protein